jgi:hypothetical protein
MYFNVRNNKQQILDVANTSAAFSASDVSYQLSESYYFCKKTLVKDDTGSQNVGIEKIRVPNENSEVRSDGNNYVPKEGSLFAKEYKKIIP